MMYTQTCLLFYLIYFTSAFSIFSVFNAIVDSVSIVAGLSVGVPEDARLTIEQLAEKYRYNFEKHEVVTEDGYILDVHRIGSKNVTRHNITVLLMHGIMESSDSWLLQGPESSLGYILADKGFDVWMGNSRGNKHALKHINMSSTQMEYWKFTWEEIGLYDLPATIDYILKATGKQDLYYIGHSQGTTSFYVMTSMKPDYNNKVKMMFSLAPEAWMGHVKSAIVRMFSPANDFFGQLLSNFNIFTSSIEFFNKMSTILCTILPGGCDNILYGLMGSNNGLDQNLLPVILGHMPTGSSTLQFVHYGQLVQSGKFRRFDYGKGRNMEKYGRFTPPDYNCSNIIVPMVIYYSDNDLLSDVKDVEMLLNCLPNVFDAVYAEGFSHVDYVYSSEAKHVIYSDVIFRIEMVEMETDFDSMNYILASDSMN